MNTKSEVLKILEENKGKAMSGADIANSLHLTRTSMWKAINELKEEGYKIDSSTKKGYVFSGDNNKLSSEGILAYLDKDLGDIKVLYKDRVESTNKDLLELAASGEKDIVVEAASYQSSGRGRIGRKFESPEGGIYFSILLNMRGVDFNRITIITPMAAVAVARAVEKLTKKSVGIKWVNDVFIDGKKICGILTQASIDIETNSINSAVVGIGIDFQLKDKDIPSELKDIIGTIYREDETPLISQNELLANVVNELVYMYKDLTNKAFLREYISHSIVLGKEISFDLNNNHMEGVAIDIDDNAALIVRLQNGEEIKLNSGEVSIKISK